MKVLVVGSGGREHALAWSLKRSPKVSEILVAPGNAGTATCGENLAVGTDDIPALVQVATERRVDLVVVGPEAPLAAGLVDALKEVGIPAFGPSRAAAQIEASKAFAKDFMRENGIPTAEYAVFEDYRDAKRYLDKHPAPIVIKASGLAAGKGAIVCQTDREAQEALQMIMVERKFGSAGDQVVIEECLHGQEVSVLAFTDGYTVTPMVLSQDHKPAYDGDRGPNTGGMGCYAPAPVLSPQMLARVQNEVLQAAVDGLRRRGTPYVGVLYAGLMVAGDQFRVLEFNCRFGDPETQVILPLLETDLVEVIWACLDGSLSDVELEWRDAFCVCVVMASGGYPGSYQKGFPIEGLDRVATLSNVVVFHAGTALKDGQVVTNGGRVLGVTAWAPTLREAVDRSYQAVSMIDWPGVMYRRDIAAKGLMRPGNQYTDKEGADG